MPSPLYSISASVVHWVSISYAPTCSSAHLTEPGPRVPSAVAAVYLTPIWVCGQAGIPQPLQGPETPCQPCSDAGLASWGLGWENTPLSFGVCASSLPVSLTFQKLRGNPMGLGDPGRGRVAHFLRFLARWLCSAFIFPMLWSSSLHPPLASSSCCPSQHPAPLCLGPA